MHLRQFSRVRKISDAGFHLWLLNYENCGNCFAAERFVDIIEPWAERTAAEKMKKSENYQINKNIIKLVQIRQR